MAPQVHNDPSVDLLYNGVARLGQRLTRAMDAVDVGNFSAADDLSAILRVLIADGKGNKAVARLLAAAHLEAPLVTTTANPVTGTNVILATGNMPTDGRDQSAPAPMTRRFDVWTKATSFVVGRARRPEISWSTFVNETGNTTGSHLSSTTPDILEHSTLFGTAELSLHHYLLRQVGWVVERALFDILGPVGLAVGLKPDRSIDVHNVLIGRIELVTVDLTTFKAAVEFMAARFPIEIMTFEYQNKRHRAYTDAGGHFSMAMEDLV